MAPIPFADNFLAGSIITLLLPVGLLIALAIWYVIAIRRVPDNTPSRAQRGEQPADASPTAGSVQRDASAPRP